MATSVAFDFKGSAVEEQRQLVTSKTTQPDWSALLGHSTIAGMATAATSLLDAETFSASSEREVKHRGSSTAETVVGEITYNVRGQRESVVYGSK